MAAMTPSHVLTQKLAGFDEELLRYITNILDEWTLDERRNIGQLKETIAPFIVDTGFADEAGADSLCRDIAIAFGGSGYNKGNNNNTNSSSSSGNPLDDAPILLSAPIKIIDNAPILTNVKHTYGGAVLAEASADSEVKLSNNSQLDVSSIPTTQKQLRKMRKENEALQKILKAEASARAELAAELAAARMAAIRASRASGRQANTGVNIERLTLPHPSGTGDLLTDVPLILSTGRRYGLVGRNGAGKSTLLRCLANYKVEGLMHLKILLVEQHVEGDDDTALEWLLRADVERTSLLEDEARLNSYLHGSTEEQKLPDDLKGVNLEMALQEIYERMDLIGVHTAEVRAKKILLGLGFTPSLLSRPTSDLSGGWAMRAALGAAIFVKPNLLLLDEPTNHLDLHALVWLEHWLINEYDGMALIVSHDTYFLNSVCTDVLELRSVLAGASKSSLECYTGDYSTYQNTLAERKIAQNRAKIAFEKEKEKLREFVNRQNMGDSKSFHSQRKMKMKQLEAMVEIDAVEEDSELVMTFPSPYGVFSTDEKLLNCTNASFAWPGEDPLFENVEFSLYPRARLAVLGKNGCGKTSLLNVLMGECAPTSGSASKHLGCRVTMLQQHHYKGEQLDPNLCALDHIRRLPQDESSAVGKHDPGTRQEETSQRSYLSNFGLKGGRAMIPVKFLSGGQRMRVALAVALFRRPDVLILDEPTNHLDTDTVRALCEALESYAGAIIAVSHDEAFVNRVIATAVVDQTKAGDNLTGELWVLSKKKLARYDGSFSQYKRAVRKIIMAHQGTTVTDDI